MWSLSNAFTNEAEPLLAQFALDSIRNRVNVPPDGGSADRGAEREDFGQDAHRQAIGHQPRELAFQIRQLRRRALRQNLGRGLTDLALVGIQEHW